MGTQTVRGSAGLGSQAGHLHPPVCEVLGTVPWHSPRAVGGWVAALLGSVILILTSGPFETAISPPYPKAEMGTGEKERGAWQGLMDVELHHTLKPKFHVFFPPRKCSRMGAKEHPHPDRRTWHNSGCPGRAPPLSPGQSRQGTVGTHRLHTQDNTSCIE